MAEIPVNPSNLISSKMTWFPLTNNNTLVSGAGKNHGRWSSLILKRIRFGRSGSVWGGMGDIGLMQLTFSDFLSL